MPSKEIKELRQSGRLEEALEMARNEFQADPENIWTKRNLSWVYYEYLKLNLSSENFEELLVWLNEIVALELPEEEKMLFDSLSFQIGKLLFAMSKEMPIPLQKIYQLFEFIRDFHFTKPSEG